MPPKPKLQSKKPTLTRIKSDYEEFLPSRSIRVMLGDRLCECDERVLDDIEAIDARRCQELEIEPTFRTAPSDDPSVLQLTAEDHWMLTQMLIKV